MILFFCCFEIPFIAVRMWASCIDYLPPGEAEKRVCAAFGFERTATNSTAFQLNSQHVDFAKIWTLPTNL
jgi:hypothetical protein